MIEPTIALARAAGIDAGNRSMRSAGRSEWDEDDYNAASEAYARVADLINPSDS